MAKGIIIFAVLIAASALAGLYWLSIQKPGTRSAQLYQDTLGGSAPNSAEPSVTSVSATPTVAPEEQVPNPPLSQSTTLQEIEADLEKTVIEDENFSDI